MDTVNQKIINRQENAEKMNLVQAHDLETVKSHYINVIENTPEIEKTARWVYGRHPTDEGLRSYIENGEMYLLMSDQDTVAGMVAIVLHQGTDYEAVPWAEKLGNDQVATLHLLAVCPEYRGRALGITILELAGELAKQQGRKAVRLDTLESNLPAQHMYEKAGYVYRGKQRSNVRLYTHRHILTNSEFNSNMANIRKVDMTSFSINL